MLAPGGPQLLYAFMCVSLSRISDVRSSLRLPRVLGIANLLSKKREEGEDKSRGPNSFTKETAGASSFSGICGWMEPPLQSSVARLLAGFAFIEGDRAKPRLASPAAPLPQTPSLLSNIEAGVEIVRG